ncbi:MAG: YkvA family protein [Desulfotomaculaceae bacterium]
MALFGVFRKWKRRAKGFKKDAYVLYYAYRDPRMPWYAKLFVLCVVGYVFSPIDLVPDFIPVLGYLDDLILIPLGINLAMKMIPGPVLADSKRRVETQLLVKPKNRVGVVLVPLFWSLVIVLVVWLIVNAI